MSTVNFIFFDFFSEFFYFSLYLFILHEDRFLILFYFVFLFCFFCFVFFLLFLLFLLFFIYFFLKPYMAAAELAAFRQGDRVGVWRGPRRLCRSGLRSGTLVKRSNERERNPGTPLAKKICALLNKKRQN